MSEIPKAVWWTAAGLAGFVALAFGLVMHHNWEAEKALSRIAISGGGFIYNYRIADIKAGVTVIVQKDVPETAELSAHFAIPPNGIDLRLPVRPGKRTYVLETKSLTGVTANTDYPVTVSLLESPGGPVLDTHEKLLKSGLAPKKMPSAPLTIGPGYHPNQDKTASPDS